LLPTDSPRPPFAKFVFMHFNAPIPFTCSPLPAIPRLRGYEYPHRISQFSTSLVGLSPWSQVPSYFSHLKIPSSPQHSACLPQESPLDSHAAVRLSAGPVFKVLPRLPRLPSRSATIRRDHRSHFFHLYFFCIFPPFIECL